MKTIFSVALAVSALAGIAAAPTSAAVANGKHGQFSSGQNDAGDWYPHDASQLPFGSQRWWDQKESEGSTGR